MPAARLAAAALTGYALGTVPSADIAARLATGGAVDLRTTGSGNPGAANAIGVLGKKWGLAVMAVDIAKGAAASSTGRRIAGTNGAHIAGTAAVVGHCWPVWSGFKGGKGVATGVGQCAVTFPVFAPIDLAVAAVSAVPKWRTRTRASTTIGLVAWVVGALIWWRKKLPNAWGPTPTGALPVAAAASSAVILTRFYRIRATVKVTR